MPTMTFRQRAEPDGRVRMLIWPIIYIMSIYCDLLGDNAFENSPRLGSLRSSAVARTRLV